ncbi:DUF1549 domain-containing protein [Paludibaculum fermentans]|uniref:DUF1549 domain-containing protein n=1 Tax=Paludibaculum fermentans TaxID=1473598 RepID=UPI003EBF959A
MTARRIHTSLTSVFVLAACAGCVSAAKAQVVEETAEPQALSASGENCSFIAAPEKVLSRADRIRREVYDRTLSFAKSMGKTGSVRQAVSASELPWRSFIDEEIFRKLEADGISPAALSSDEEYFRRIKLDLTGRIPTAAEIRAFVADTNPAKRDEMVDKLLYSPEFVDKWTVWLGDLLQNSITASNRNQNQEGRNRFHEYIKEAIDSGKSWREIAYQLVTATGNNYDRDTAGVNFMLRGFAPMGPAQDTYDLVTVRAATMFLGLGHYDCLLCHNGRGHLDAVSAWGAKTLRVDAQRMSAHFARINLSTYPGRETSDYYLNSTIVLDRPTGSYSLNTTYGNRPNRVATNINGVAVTNLTPLYRDGTTPAGDWRDSFAQRLTNDPMFARNYANRLWKAMFNLALAEPVDNLDPDRLNPNVPPPSGWDYQASHPVLLEKLAQAARDNDFNLRETLRLIVQSTAYQLSSRFDGDWDLTKVSTFARHLPRRLEAEEAHDAITKATGLLPSYSVGGWVEKVNWAMQLPEPTEPRSDGTANAFMNSFSRGNRDTQPRSASGSVLMWLNMMNSTLVTNRTRATGATASPYLAELAKNKADDVVVQDIFLTFLSRSPSEHEKSVALKTLAKSGTATYTRAAAVEDLAWALINKTDFLFSY